MRNLSEDLISVFNRSSSQGTHPDEIGRAKEIEVKTKLEAILPAGVGVGRGIVIDSFGNTSNQCDIVIYDKNIVPTFVNDNNTDYTYFPCEGVIAVGEIKSTLTIDELNNSLPKLEKIKLMQRRIRSDNDKTVYRKYLSPLTIVGAPFNIFDPVNNNYDSIYTFIFAKTDVIAEKTIIKILIEKYADKIYLCPNTIYSLDKPNYHKGFVKNDSTLLLDNNQNCIIPVDSNESLVQLVTELSFFIQQARTQEFVFLNYCTPELTLRQSVSFKK